MPPPFRLLNHHTTRDHGLNILEFLLPENASTELQTFLARWFLIRIFKNCFSIFAYVKCAFSSIDAPTKPQNHDCNRSESTLFKYASSKLKYLLQSFWVKKKIIFFFYIFLSKMLTTPFQMWPLGIMIWTNLNRYHLKMLPQQFKFVLT